MTNKWRTVILGDCIKINDAAYSPKEAWPFINYLDTGNITGNCISEIQYLVVGKDKIPSRARRKVQQGDIVYSTVRPNQRHFGLIKKLPNNFLASTGFAVISGKEDLALTDFIYWFLAQDHIVDHLQTLAEQNTSAYPSIRPSDIERLELKLPPLPEQRAIAHILGTLDDKIELNRRMNETLEEMARAIFKSWFVDFDPVRAKMDGSWRRGESLPGMPAEMYDLFPSRLVDSELGEIPEGWRVGPIGSIFNQQKRRIGEAHAVVLSAVTKGELVRSDEYFTKKVYSKSINKYLAVEQWDIAYNPSRINIGSVGMLKEPVLGAVSPVYIVVRPESEYRWYMEFFLRLSQAKKWIETLATGSVRQALSYQDFASIPCVIPPPRVVRGFDEHQDQFYLTFKAHSKESQILVDLRDTLLPKLLSGELRVRDAEKFMESVV